MVSGTAVCGLSQGAGRGISGMDTVSPEVAYPAVVLLVTVVSGACCRVHSLEDVELAELILKGWWLSW